VNLAHLYDHIRQKARVTQSDEGTEELERSLSVYTRQAWPIIDPADYLHNWHIDCISEYLEAASVGQIKRLLINLPPRNMKSIITSVSWPTWVWAKRPETKWLFTSYAQSLSTKLSVDRRLILQSDWYRRKWGDKFFLLGDQNVKTEYQNNKNGVMVATSIGGTITGKGGDFIVVDDPHNPEEIDSETIRNGVIEYFRRTLPSRLNDKKTGVIVVVMQRLHEKDLSGHIIEAGGYEHLQLPAEVSKRTVIHFPVSGRMKIREKGDILWPEREGKPELEALKRALGSYNYSAQYEQDPSAAEGGTFKRWWWRYWHYPDRPLPPVEVKLPDGTYQQIHPVPLPGKFDEQLQSWDCAFKDDKDNDYVVGQVWARLQADKFLLDQFKDHADIIKTMEAIVKMTAKHPKATLKLIEDKANGSAVIQMLRRKIGGLVPVEPEGGKIARANAVAPEVESGNVFLPHPAIAPWVDSFINVFASFPKVANDDEVDAASQALKRMMFRFVPGKKEELPGNFYTPGELEDLGVNKFEIRKVK